MKNESTKYTKSIRNAMNKLYYGEAVEACADIIEYLKGNALEIEYTLNSQRELIGARI